LFDTRRLGCLGCCGTVRVCNGWIADTSECFPSTHCAKPFSPASWRHRRNSSSVQASLRSAGRQQAILDAHNRKPTQPTRCMKLAFGWVRQESGTLCGMTGPKGVSACQNGGITICDRARTRFRERPPGGAALMRGAELVNPADAGLRAAGRAPGTSVPIANPTKPCPAEIGVLHELRGDIRSNRSASTHSITTCSRLYRLRLLGGGEP
jgi:hypothetical protein